MDGNGQVQQMKKDEFFKRNAGKASYDAFAQKVYVMVHTIYLNKEGEIKEALEAQWRQNFGVDLTDGGFAYLEVNDPIILSMEGVTEVRQGNKLEKMRNLAKTLVALEFDLWMIARYKAGKSLNWSEFDGYIDAKYGNFLNMQMGNYRKFNLLHIKSLRQIADDMLPYEDKIQDFFDKLYNGNKTRIDVRKPNADRAADYICARQQEMVKASKPGEASVSPKTLAEVSVKETTAKMPEVSLKTEEPAAMPPLASSTNAATAPADCAEDNRIREYQFILKKQEERIEKLENDLKERKRQRDEAEEEAKRQYEKGIRELFSQLNSVRNSKIIDYFYSLLQDENTEENLASYLDNFFMVLEDMGIEPMVTDEEVVVTEENVTKDYNLDFDKKEFEPANVKVKYVGWKYKEIPIEKPTLTLKEKK